MSARRSPKPNHCIGHSDESRRSIAVEAARLMAEHGIRDFHQAKRKAAARLGIDAELALPTNRQIEAALREHQRLFHAADQPRLLRRRREVALDAMRFFVQFQPRLVGAVLEGTADAHSAVCLHVFCDDPGAVANFLREQAIPCTEQTRRLRHTRDTTQLFPAYVFSADGTPIDITVLPLDLMRQAPFDRVTERPMRRASRAVLEALLAQEATNAGDPRQPG